MTRLLPQPYSLPIIPRSLRVPHRTARTPHHQPTFPSPNHFPNHKPNTLHPSCQMFAPYQADPPEASRSPDIASPRTSLERRPWSPLGGSYNYQKRTNQASPPPLQHPQPQRSWQTPGYQISSPSYQQSPAPGAGGVAANNNNYNNVAAVAAGVANVAPSRPSLSGDGYFGHISSGFAGATVREGINEFDTSLGIRLDYEACLAYLALPPLGAIILLILERKSDYVR